MLVAGYQKKLLGCFLGILLCISGTNQVAAQTVKLPITIDYRLLQTLIVRSAYTEANQSVTLLNRGSGCLFLALSKPNVSEANGALRFETQISLHAGTPLGDRCAVPVAWQGYLILNQRPVIDSKTMKLSFSTISSSLLEKNRQPARIANAVWSLFQPQVFSYLESIRIDLAPPVNDLKTFLLPLFPPSVQQETQTMLRTLRTGETRVGPESVTVDLLADVKEAYRPGDQRATEVLTGKALDEMVGVWEQWDALLSFLVTSMSRNVLTEEERQTLMDVLLDTRYKFVEGLSSQSFTHDFVREQFVKAWRHLSPIFRNHVGQNPDDQSLGFLSFFTAADALSVLDGLGPTFGIEMSRDGLIRMARMLTRDPSILSYGAGVNLDLRKLFQLMPLLQVDKVEPADENLPPAPEDRKNQESYIERDIPPVPEERENGGIKAGPSERVIKEAPPEPNPGNIKDDSTNPDDENGNSSLQQEKSLGNPNGALKDRQSKIFPLSFRPMAMIWDFLLAPAYAGEPVKQSDIMQWRVPENGVDQYVQKVLGVLNTTSQTLASKSDLPVSLQGMFRPLITAMAWQESCFRQFVEKNNQMTYLLSYNNTSVGMMQVNERVWRGLYDQERLRWDINYNAAAGGEIALLYLKKYALRDKNNAKKLDPATFARLVYAMYNGGPGQYQDFLERSQKGKMLKTDDLFWEKYSWVTSGNLEKCSQCLN
jgi:hypothetical protein